MKPYGKDARVEGGGLLETPMPLTLGTLSNSVICTSVPFRVPLTLGTQVTLLFVPVFLLHQGGEGVSVLSLCEGHRERKR